MKQRCHFSICLGSKFRISEQEISQEQWLRCLVGLFFLYVVIYHVFNRCSTSTVQCIILKDLKGAKIRQCLFCHQDGGSNRLGRNEVNIKDKP